MANNKKRRVVKAETKLTEQERKTTKVTAVVVNEAGEVIQAIINGQVVANPPNLSRSNGPCKKYIGLDLTEI